jgi:hypothetical protein
MLKKYFKNESLDTDKANLLQSVVGMGDILVFEVGRNNNKRVISSLKELFNLIDNLFAIKEVDPERFEKIIWSKKYYELYDKNPQGARFYASINSEEYTDGFTTIVNQVMRVYKMAITQNNNEVAIFAIYNLNKVLSLLAASAKGDLFVDQTLRKSIDIIFESITNNNVLLFSRAVSWYRSMVFNVENTFCIEYLKLFDGCFFEAIKKVIDLNNIQLFENLISNMIDGLYPDFGDREIWDFGHILLEDNYKIYETMDRENSIESRLKNLDESMKYINSVGTLDSWIEEFKYLKKIILTKLPSEKLEQATKLEVIIINTVKTQFKFNNLRNLFVYVGAYCLFKKRIQLIKCMWNYKQPDDSNATWVGYDVLPENLNNVMIIFFDLFEPKWSFFSGHHGSDTYVKDYFLLLLCRLIRSSASRYSEFESYQLPDLNVNKLSDMTYRCDEMVSQAKKLFENSKLLSKLGFDKDDELLDKKLIPFIKHIKVDAEIQIQSKHRSLSISSEKIKKFKDDFVKEFYELATFRSIITNYFSAFKNFIHEPIDDAFRLGLNISMEDKAVFFESWYISYGDWIQGYARSFALGENSYIFNEIVGLCQQIKANDINEIILKFEQISDVVIITSSMNIHKIFDKNEEFKASWRNDTNKLPVKGFKGWYNFRDSSIPIFAINNAGDNKSILILDSKKFGSLYQYSPLNKNDDERNKNNIFYMDIRLLTERLDLLKSFNENPPEWYQKIGDAKSRQDYVQERVAIEIFEKLKFVPAKDFFGFNLSLEMVNGGHTNSS